jgi:ubiquinone/menaquinone biosynthesis C-methylase UbiE
VEVDGRLARSLAGRLAGTNVTVLHADATALPFEAGRFSAATLFTMLHHVPSAAQQDQMLAELRRVLRPGGLLAGTDGVETPARRELHTDDDYLPIDPASMADRLAGAGFTRVTVEVEEDRFRFAATAPAAGG